MLREAPPTLTGGGVSTPSLPPPTLPQSEWGLYNRRTSDSRVLMERGSQPGRLRAATGDPADQTDGKTAVIFFILTSEPNFTEKNHSFNVQSETGSAER